MFDTHEHYRRADALCQAMMALRPDLPSRSLDEWLLCHDSKLTEHEKAAAWSILALHPDGASFDPNSSGLEDF